jgi:hypothetical protein
MRVRLTAAILAAYVSSLAAGCGRDTIPLISAAPSTCPASLEQRLQVFDIPVTKNIAWQKFGYDGFPFDERLALAVHPSGQNYVAWGEVNASSGTGDVNSSSPPGVRVTPLDGNWARRGDDVVLAGGREVSGLVAHDNGFAILMRGDNPGAAIDIGDSGDSPTVASLVRYKNGAQAWQSYLTGTLSKDAAETQTVYSPFLEGQLVWNESFYGAYFVVRGGTTDANPRFWWDTLVYRDSFGQPTTPLSPTHGCSNNGGIRLLADSARINLQGSPSTEMIGLCVQQSRVALKFTSLENNQTVSSDEVYWPGYAGAKLGSLVKTGDAYLVFWLSLGGTNDHQGHDIRMARFDASFSLVSGPVWLTRTPGVEEWNLHVVPYGTDRFLMMYGEIDITRPADDTDWAMYLGTYAGTRLKIISADGTTLTETTEPIQAAPTTANAEPVVLPNGDVAWAFANPAPDYSKPIVGPNGPGQTTLHIARVCYAP